MRSLEIEQLSKEYGKVVALDQLSLTVHEGERVALVGASGCGKTTLLRLISGLETASHGKVKIAGKDVTNASPRNRDVAMVFQDFALYPSQTVKQNLSLGMQFQHQPKKVINDRIAETAEAFNLTVLLDRYPEQLSGGEQQRVAVARALIRQPSVLLLDEPFSNLDARLREDFRFELLRLHQQFGTTMLHVTHDQNEAMWMGNRIAVMEAGKIVQLGTADELYYQPASRFVAAFFGSPPMNFFALNRNGDRWQTGDFCWPMDVAVSQDASGAEVGIRPEAFQIDLPGEGFSEADPLLFHATVVSVHALGPQLCLQCEWQKEQLCVICDRSATTRPLPLSGDDVTLRVSKQDLHLFEGEQP
ncbi:Maltose/maltodextrin import ATP-binding protein MalK [Roseimaritima multifibrata]|uniref:Maltose/maltodextrin import ATP-binding protein MalK n=1 Tax=Roseimaritima multifibrata TaxID=1930274 RepID=A0A517MCM9_9BACT|nr:ABC transporter ATP-binding protein [Roseimaritima multifibrata]QDS92650.1 Maltose/maltodextrin import ATP-binding protein MalK [Roseimaritima multifibrata]